MVVEELYLSYTSTDLKDPWLEINPILTTIKEVYGLRILWILNKVQALLPAGTLTQHGGLALFGDHKGKTPRAVKALTHYRLVDDNIVRYSLLFQTQLLALLRNAI